MKISQKLITLFLLSALTPVISVGIFAYVISRNALESRIETEITNVANRQADTISSLVRDYYQELTIFNNRQQVRTDVSIYNASHRTADQQTLSTYLAEARLDNRSMRRIHILNSDGTVIGSSDPVFIGRSYKDTEVFAVGRKADNTSITFIDVNGEPGVYLTGPLILHGQQIGTTVIEYQVAGLQAVLKDYSDLGTTGETFLVRKVDKQARYVLPLRFDNTAMLKTSNVASSNGLDYRNQPVLRKTRTVKGTDWTMYVQIAKAEVFAPVYHISKLTLAVLGATTVVACVLGWLIATWLVAPLRRLTATVRQIEGGNFGVRVPVSTHDEIGILGSVFNDMTAKLSNYYNELETKVRERTKELEAAQTRLQQNIKQDEALLSSIGDGVIATDRDGSFTWANKSAAKILQIDPADIIGKKYDDDAVWRLETEKGDPISHDEQPINQALSTERQVLNTEHYYARRDKDGNPLVRFALAVNVAPVMLNDKLIGTIIVFRDITHERQVDRMKSEFISLASHQLRTPLSAIKWFTEMLISGDAGKLQAEQEEFAHNIYDSTERMIELVRSLLNISRIESGRIIIDPKPTDIKGLLGGIVNDLKGKTEERRQTLIISVHENLPKINLDPHLIGQVYLNLLTNAIKYTPKGGEISVYVSRKDDQVISQVSDNGYGIPKAEQSKMFQKFFRASNITKVETDGTGLGMYLIKSIIESSGGKIWFESEEGKGTTFWFTIPVSGMKAKEGEVTLDNG